MVHAKQGEPAVMADEAGPSPPPLASRIEQGARRAVLALRLIMVPIYVGLFGALLIDLVKFLQKLVQAAPKVLSMGTSEAILVVLGLIDLALVGNLVIIVIFAGWSNVIGPLYTGSGSTDPLAGFSFNEVKLKLIGAMAAIATIQMLETFVHVNDIPPSDVMWQLAILIGIGVTGVLLALMDRIANHQGHSSHPGHSA
jgi:uncharacterized protein (TIGR00645 family)